MYLLGVGHLDIGPSYVMDSHVVWPDVRTRAVWCPVMGPLAADRLHVAGPDLDIRETWLPYVNYSVDQSVGQVMVQ
jgi:hypothetical protein